MSAGILSAALLLTISCAMISCSKTKDRPKTVADRLEQYGGVVQRRLTPYFDAAAVTYPPRRVTLIGVKKDMVLEVYASEVPNESHFIRAYPILAASGALGPKFHQGDKQVPEGVYRLRELNPNSHFHLSLWVDYPNGFDRMQAIAEHRSNLGGEIMIHGDAVSAGCLAMGDEAAEDLFVLAALTGIENITVILTPIDFRTCTYSVLPNESSPWLDKLYATLRTALFRYPK